MIFFPFKHHFLNLQVNECKGQVNRVTCLLESCLSHHQVTSCTAPSHPVTWLGSPGSKQEAVSAVWDSLPISPSDGMGGIRGREAPRALPFLQSPLSGRVRVSAHILTPALGGSFSCGVHGCQEWCELVVIVPACLRPPSHLSWHPLLSLMASICLWFFRVGLHPVSPSLCSRKQTIISHSPLPTGLCSPGSWAGAGTGT